MIKFLIIDKIITRKKFETLTKFFIYLMEIIYNKMKIDFPADIFEIIVLKNIEDMTERFYIDKHNIS